MKNAFKIGLVALAIAAPVGFAFYSTAPSPAMDHISFPKKSAKVVHYAPASFQRAVVQDSAPNEMNPVPTASKPESKSKAPAKRAPRAKSIGAKPAPGQTCELHALEQGGSPSAPFVLYCH